MCTSIAFAILYGMVRWHTLHSAPSRLSRASRLLERNRIDEARAEAEWVLRFDPSNPNAVCTCALCHLRRQEYAKATDILEKSPNIWRSKPEAASLLVAGLLGDFQMERAEEVLQRCVVKFPNSIGLRAQLSGLLLAQQRYFDAQQVWSNYLRLSTTQSLPLAHLLSALIKSAKARFHAPSAGHQYSEMLRASLERHPEQTTVAAALAQSLAEAGEVELAKGIFEQLISYDHVKIGSLLKAAHFFSHHGFLDAAEGCITRITEEDDTSLASETAKVLCTIHMQNDDFDAALKSIEEAINSQTKNAALYAKKAQILQRLGRTEPAKFAYRCSHELATAELRLWKTTRSLPENPSLDECHEVAELYRQLGDDLHFRAWKELAEKLNSKTGHAPQ